MVKKIKVYIMRGYDKKGRVVPACDACHIKAYSLEGAINQVKKLDKHVVKTRAIHTFTPEAYDKWLRKGYSRTPRWGRRR